MLLRGEPMPARFRSSFTKPSPLRPNVATALSFDMAGHHAHFQEKTSDHGADPDTWIPLMAAKPAEIRGQLSAKSQRPRISKRRPNVFIWRKNDVGDILPIQRR